MEFYSAYPVAHDAINPERYDQVDDLFSLGVGRDYIEKEYGRRVFFMDQADMQVHQFLEKKGVPVLRLEVIDRHLGRLIVPEGTQRFDSIQIGAYSDDDLRELITPLGRILRNMYESSRLMPRQSVLESFVHWPDVNRMGVGIAACPPYDFGLEPNPSMVQERLASELLHDVHDVRRVQVMMQGISRGWEYVG